MSRSLCRQLLSPRICNKRNSSLYRVSVSVWCRSCSTLRPHFGPVRHRLLHVLEVPVAVVDSSDTALPGRMTFHTAYVDLTAMTDDPRTTEHWVPHLFLSDFELNTCPTPSDAVVENIDPVEEDVAAEAASVTMPFVKRSYRFAS